MSEQRLIDYFYSGFWLYLTSTFVLAFISVIIFIFRKRLFDHFSNSLVSKIGVYLTVTIFIVGSIITGVKYINFLKDLDNVRNRKFLTMNAIMIDFAIVGEGNSPEDPILAYPIFKDIESGEEITLSIKGKVEKGGNYQILYLKNSKIGVVVE